MDEISPEKLVQSILDLNSKDVPEYVLEKFYEFKSEIGSKPMGISLYQDVFYFIDTAGNIHKKIDKKK